MGAELFKRRLTKAFESYGLDVHNHVVFMPWLSPGEFYGLMNAVDVFMDSLGFSGFNTAMQALECALPIAAKEARFMRGRFASAILRRLELHSCVATSDNEYVDLVVRLASEPAFNSEVRQTIAQRRQELYNDTEPVRAIEQFLITKCQVN
jgi:predicted O-linked N-acetylglucosamine transferase (SPINDLY family)